VIFKKFVKTFLTPLAVFYFRLLKLNLISPPPFRLQYISHQTGRIATRGFGVEIRFEGVRAMMAAIKGNIIPGICAPFNLWAATR
jgi:hypothetical protein